MSPDLPEFPGLLPCDGPEAMGWHRLADLPLVVVVGVTGVGKSTALSALGGVNVLPDRRALTDALIIGPQLDGREELAALDREERFQLTGLYRHTHPGGMAEALGALCADEGRWPAPLLFDGLRGTDEVGYALERFPDWRFVSLFAPDEVRVRRLLGRRDRFDALAGSEDRPAVSRPAPPRLYGELEALNTDVGVFTPEELDRLARLPAEGYAPAGVIAATRIVLSERRQYDPQAARALLAGHSAFKVLDLDTLALSPDAVAGRIRAWL